MIVAVAMVRMMKMAFHEIVRVASVRDRFMPARGFVSVLSVVGTARMVWGTGRWIGPPVCQGVFIYMPLVDTVKVPVMQIIDVSLVLNRGVPEPEPCTCEC